MALPPSMELVLAVSSISSQADANTHLPQPPRVDLFPTNAHLISCSLGILDTHLTIPRPSLQHNTSSHPLPTRTKSHASHGRNISAILSVPSPPHFPKSNSSTPISRKPCLSYSACPAAEASRYAGILSSCDFSTPQRINADPAPRRWCLGSVWRNLRTWDSVFSWGFWCAEI